MLQNVFFEDHDNVLHAAHYDKKLNKAKYMVTKTKCFCVLETQYEKFYTSIADEKSVRQVIDFLMYFSHQLSLNMCKLSF